MTLSHLKQGYECRVKRVLALLVLFPMCVFAQMTPEEKTVFERMEDIDTYIYGAPEFLDDSSENALRATADILEESCEEVENPRAAGLLTYCTIRFHDGLEVRYRMFGDPERLGLIRIHVDSPRWVFRHDVRVGRSPEFVVEALGEASETTESRLVYSGETEQAIFEVEEGVVEGIRMLYYAD